MPGRLRITVPFPRIQHDNSMPSATSLPNFSLAEFSPATPEEWKAAAEKLLKGAPFEKKMITRTYEGIDLRPIYMPQDRAPLPRDSGFPGEAPFRRGTTSDGHVLSPWWVSQEFPYGDPQTANAALVSDIERGQTAAYFPLDAAARLGLDPDKADPSQVGSGGLSVSSIADLAVLLKGVDLTAVPVHIEADLGTPALLAMLVAYADREGVPADHLSGAVTTDPLGFLLREGSLPCSLGTAYDRMYDAAFWLSQNAPGLRSVAVRGRVFHDAGASAVQELALTVAAGVEYLRAMLDRGLPVDDAAKQIWFSLCSGTHFFMEVAKFRAARMLWATAVEVFGGSESAQRMMLHIRTSAFTVTAVDPYVNMLRATTQALAGVVAGCDSMHVGFFDEAVRYPDEFSRRIARNTQSILQSEAHLREVIDPAGGSWYVESLTDEIAQRSWKLFQEVEAAGGIGAAIVKGDVQEWIRTVGAQRADGVARRKDPIVGVSSYANPAERPLQPGPEHPSDVSTHRADAVRSYRTQRDSSGSAAAVARIAARSGEGPGGLMSALIDAAARGATVGEMTRSLPGAHNGDSVKVQPLKPMRMSAGFEDLRNAMNARAAETGRLVTVFLATMGPVGQHKARADFAAAFFAVAGCDVVCPAGFSTPEVAAREACASGADITVLCSTDETYPALVAPFCTEARRLRKDLTIVLAGYPQDHIDAFRAAGIDEFIHIRSNVLDTLRTLLGSKGVRP